GGCSVSEWWWRRSPRSATGVSPPRRQSSPRSYRAVGRTSQNRDRTETFLADAWSDASSPHQRSPSRDDNRVHLPWTGIAEAWHGRALGRPRVVGARRGGLRRDRSRRWPAVARRRRGR